MADTAKRGYPKPVSSNFVSDDVLLLMQAFDMIDADVDALLAALAGKAANGHGHDISDIGGLAAALAALAPLNHNHALANLSDTSGLAGAPDGYVLRKLAGAWQAASTASLFTSHTHVIGDITNLQAALNERLTVASFSGATAKGTPVDADTVPLNDSAASGALKRLSWANLKATLKAYFDTLYAAVGHSHAAATTGAAGFMSAADKAKLNGITGGHYNRIIYKASSVWTKPAGLVKVIITCVGGGGGGGGGHSTLYDNTTTTGGTGSSGAASQSEVLAISLGGTEVVSVGVGGTPGSPDANDAGDGGTSSFGEHCTAPGGLHGTLSAGGLPPPAGVGNIFAVAGMTGRGEDGTGTLLTGTGPLIGPRDIPAAPPGASDGTSGRPNSGQGAAGGRGAKNKSRTGGSGGSGYVIVEEFF